MGGAGRRGRPSPAAPAARAAACCLACLAACAAGLSAREAAAKRRAREAVARGAPGALQTLCMLTIVGKVYWHHQRKAAGDLIVGCRLNYTQGEHSRRCSKAWSMLANTSALGVTNEYIAAPSNCAARPVPKRAVVSLSRGGGTSAPAADGARPPPAVFVAVTRHPLERWQSEMSYGLAVAMKNLEGVWRLFAPRGVTDTGHGFPRWLRRGKVYPRADASAGELIAAEASLRAWMAHDWERDGDPEGGWKRCGPGGHMHRVRRLRSDCYVDNQLTRILSADCRCRLYDAAALYRALRPGVAEAVGSVSSGESSDGLLTASESSQPGPWLIFNNFENLQNATDGRNYTVGRLSGCPLETHAPVTRVHLDRAKEVAGRYHVLAAMEDAVAGGGVVFGNVLRALAGMNVSRGFRLERNEHASPASLQLLAVPGMRRALAESNWADLELFRWMRQDLWPRYVAEAARVEAANQLG